MTGCAVALKRSMSKNGCKKADKDKHMTLQVEIP